MMQYKHAKLPRPLGPLGSQSREFLENTLVKSTQVGVKWNKQTLAITSKVTWFEPEWLALQGDHWEVVAGLWLVIPHITGHDILCYDLERGLRHVVYHADGTQILSFKSTTSEAADGGYIERLFGNKLLFVRFSSDGPSLEFSMLSAGKRLLCMSNHLTGTLNLVVDTRTHVLYRFPPPSSIIDSGFATSCMQETYLKRLIATETHVLAIQPDEGGNCRAIIQAFTLPPVGTTTTASPTLQLTHEGHRYLDIERISLLCDSMTNAGAGQTQIKFLTHCMRLNLTKYFAHRVTLSPPLPGQKLGNMSLSIEQLFSVPGYADTMKFYHPCSGTVGPGVDIKEVEATESFPSSLRMTWNVRLAFDGNLGRICYRKRGQEGRNVLAIVDLA
ncbi:hypothetical protein EDB19DRAFT_1738515 [Suillus lakei]|nr:hypothetical protein EDB19DRAFT_1738515 [Suillus lakei]